MKKIIKILLLVGFLFSNNSTNYNFNTGFSISSGLLSEKIPVTLIDATVYRYYNNYDEFFGSFSYLVFGGGIGIGIKKYLFNRKKSSPFATLVYSAGVLGDGYDTWSGFSNTIGYSLIFKQISESKLGFRLGSDAILGLNIGCGFIHYNNEHEPYLFLNFEVKGEVNY